MIDEVRKASALEHPRQTILGSPISRTAWAWLDVEGEMSVAALDKLIEILVPVRNNWTGNEHEKAVRQSIEKALAAGIEL
jgi:hypothetical protein